MTTNHALLLSIRPRFAISIFSGCKTVEFRRVKPRIQAGDLVVVYASGSIKGIIGAFEVAGVTAAVPNAIWQKYDGVSGLTKKEFDDYFDGANVGYAIRIRKYWRLPEPIPLNTLRQRYAGFRPPQSYHYWNLNELVIVGGDALSERLRDRKQGLGKRPGCPKVTAEFFSARSLAVGNHKRRKDG
jgi:predicted transcriptional regulator